MFNFSDTIIKSVISMIDKAPELPKITASTVEGYDFFVSILSIIKFFLPVDTIASLVKGTVIFLLIRAVAALIRFIIRQA